MEWIPEHAFVVRGGWLLSLFYLIIHFLIPISRKGSLQKLLTWPRKGKTIGKTIGFWSTQLSWWGTILYPFLCPLETDAFLFYTGISIYFIGMALTVMALWTYSSSAIDQPIVEGLYRVSRNPIYVAYTFVGYGIAISVGSWILILLHTVEVITCHFVTLDEESYCVTKYGLSYQTYLKNVPRYFWKL